jgi:thiol-disulfide isomerase/thioredoxin
MNHIRFWPAHSGPGSSLMMPEQEYPGRLLHPTRMYPQIGGGVHMQDRSTLSPLILILSIAAVVVGLSILVPMLRKNRLNADSGNPAIGKSIETIQLRPLNKAAVPVDADKIRDHVVLINFWGTWCPPCRLELPHLVQAYRDLRKNRQMMFITVSCDDSRELPELEQETEEYLRRNKFADLPTYTDPASETRTHIAELAGFGNSFSYPTTLIVDRAGVIRGVWIGVSNQGAEVTANEQRALLEALLK